MIKAIERQNCFPQKGVSVVADVEIVANHSSRSLTYA